MVWWELASYQLYTVIDGCQISGGKAGTYLQGVNLKMRGDGRGNSLRSVSGDFYSYGLSFQGDECQF